MRQLRNENLSVRIATTAWRQLGTVPSETFTRIKDRLYELAEGSPAQAQPNQVQGAPLAAYFTVDDFVAMYSVDAESKLITLLEVARRLPEAT